MPLFKKSPKTEIPAVEDRRAPPASNRYAPQPQQVQGGYPQQQGGSSSRGGSGKYGGRGGGNKDAYGDANSQPMMRKYDGQYNEYRNRANDAYNRHGYGVTEYEQEQRKKLLASAKAPADSGPNMANLDNDTVQDQEQVMDEDEEVDAIKQQMRFTKQESLASTRNAVRMARQAEETAGRTVEKLGEQSERIAQTGNHLDNAKAFNARAEDEAEEIKVLNRSIFRPSFTFNKKARRDAQEAKILARHVEEREDRELSRMEASKARQRVEKTFQDASDSSRNRDQQSEAARLADRSKYQFEATESDDEVEDEIDGNLQELNDASRRLKMLAIGAGDEVRDQNQRLAKVDQKTDNLDVKLVSNTQRLARLK